MRSGDAQPAGGACRVEGVGSAGCELPVDAPLFARFGAPSSVGGVRSGR
jgi:hypothetical protein